VGEMEGSGLYAAAQESKIDWGLVKGISDFADGNKKDEDQPIAARNAASFVLHVIQFVFNNDHNVKNSFSGESKTVVPAFVLGSFKRHLYQSITSRAPK